MQAIHGATNTVAHFYNGDDPKPFGAVETVCGRTVKYGVGASLYSPEAVQNMIDVYQKWGRWQQTSVCGRCVRRSV